MDFLANIQNSSSEESINELGVSRVDDINLTLTEENWFRKGVQNYGTLKASGNLHYLRNNYDEAVVAFKLALVELPNKYGSLQRDITDSLVRSMLKTEDKKNWLEALTLACNLFNEANNCDQKLNSCRSKAECYRKLSQFDKELECRQCIANFLPDNAVAWLELAIAYTLTSNCSILDDWVVHDHSVCTTVRQDLCCSVEDQMDIIYFCFHNAFYLFSQESLSATNFTKDKYYAKLDTILKTVTPSFKLKEYLKSFSDISSTHSAEQINFQFEICTGEEFVCKWFVWNK